MAKLSSNSIFIDSNSNKNKYDFYMDSFDRETAMDGCISACNSSIDSLGDLSADSAVAKYVDSLGEIAVYPAIDGTVTSNICSIASKADTMTDALKALTERLNALESKVYARANDFKNSFSNLNNRGLRRSDFKTLN